ncbi:MAG TPA: calcium-binding protein, partial [Burkholderiales bacterium]|nr:calcium-binding protein [Burkholderiales bacterium]
DGDINGTGNALANVLLGNSGNNVLNGGAGADQMSGGGGNDTYVIDNALDTVTELDGEGNDSITISGTPFPSDTTFYLPANVENATYSGGAVRLQLAGNELDNVLIGASGTSVLSTGLDILYGNDGNDWLDGRGSTLAQGDRLIGGPGDDTYVIRSLAATDIEEYSGQGSDTVIVGFSFDVDYFTVYNRSRSTGSQEVEIENVILTGSSNIDAFGNQLDNHLQGNSGRNTLVGEAGDDILDGGTGIDTLVGGDGDDLFIFDNIGDRAIELAGGGLDSIESSANVDLSLSPNIENITLTGSADLNATGNDDDNNLVGNEGANILNGGGGNDYLDGKAGADFLHGGDGDDRFNFDALDTAYDGGAGTDWVILSTGLSASIDLASQGSGFAGIEGFELVFENTLLLDEQSVLDLSDTSDIIYVKGDGTSLVARHSESDPAWTPGSNENIDGVLYHTYTLGAASVYVQDGVQIGLT